MSIGVAVNGTDENSWLETMEKKLGELLKIKVKAGGN